MCQRYARQTNQNTHSTSRQKAEVRESAYAPVTCANTTCVGTVRARSGASALRRLGVLALELLDERDVLGLGVALAHALVGGPGVPLGARLQLDGPRLAGGVVAGGRLLVEAVDLQHLGVRRALGQVLDLSGSFLEGLRHSRWIC
eukprot:TRINITY_DN109_c0_g1_i1.p1 TRINITY_DN109_c0_g1~~TRINITY_DN109_c0_g1_i1.p1  ORF type:complete len:145 (+),score=6.50 TRINITY_DN109_c0_g1_i1:152-586(+)